MKRLIPMAFLCLLGGIACKKDAPPTVTVPRAEARRVEPVRVEPPMPAARGVEAARPGTQAAPRVDAHADHDHRGGDPRASTGPGSKSKGDGVTTCPVSGETIGEGGMKPAEIVHNGKTIRFCCKSCVDDFKKDPEAYLKRG